MQGIAAQAYVLKGFLLGLPAPAAILQLLDEIIAKLVQPQPENPIDMACTPFPLTALPEFTAARPVPVPKPDTVKKVPALDTRTAAITHHTAKATRADTQIKQYKKRAKRLSLDPVKDLAAIQERHNAEESNGSIAKSYDCSDQTIINFLKQHGTYAPVRNWRARASHRNATPAPSAGEPSRPVAPRARKPKPKAPARKAPAPKAPAEDPPSLPPASVPRKRAVQAQAQDIMGEPLIDALPPTPEPITGDPWLNGKFRGVFYGGELIDIYDMLSAGKTLDDIAVHYKTARNIIEEFMLKNQNANMTKCTPGYNPLLTPFKKQGSII